jgi:hypothetical protein
MAMERIPLFRTPRSENRPWADTEHKGPNTVVDWLAGARGFRDFFRLRPA